jgi:hypothetical protein
MNISNSIDRDRILLRLDTFRYVAEANIEALENTPGLKEQFESGIQTVLDYVRELDDYEKSKDPNHYVSMLDSAELALERVHDLIRRILE